MSFLSDFEKRIAAIFGAAPQGYTEPFSFKRLARAAAREMENETYEIDGVDTAPALYTILVSTQDDSIMRPLYEQLTYEIANFITQQAQRKGYVFVGNPLVRFMVDPSLKSGKFAVFAENVDARTLARLREEERAFLNGSSSVGGAAAQRVDNGRAQAPVNVQTHSRAVRSQNYASTPLVSSYPNASVRADANYDDYEDDYYDEDAGLDAMPSDYAEPIPVASVSDSTPMPVTISPTPLVSAADNVPQTMRRSVPVVDAEAEYSAYDQQVASAGYGAAAAGAAAGAAQEQAVKCMLIDRKTGQTFTGSSPTVVIGRERSQCDIILRDPNVSRRHAELTYDGRNWYIRDLHSTNGTLVNDVDVDECVLRDGDLITLGLVNLEFRGSLR